MTQHMQASVLALWVSATLWGIQGLGAKGTIDLDSRMQRVRDGVVRLTYAAGEGVCGNGASWYRSRDGRSGQFNGMWNGSVSSRDVETTCDRGPVRLVVVREAGDTKAIRVYVGGRWRADTGITDLGVVAAPAVGVWLLRQAETASSNVARNALQAAMLGDSIAPGTTLLRIARDDSRSQDVRQSAVHWLGEIVGERAVATLDSIAYEPGDRDVRRTAIMSLAQRPRDEAIPALTKLAESHPDRELRRAAIMALARTRDPQAVAWLERRLQRP